MGEKLTKQVKGSSIVFLAANSDDRDKLRHFFGNPAFGGNDDERYDYFDEVLTATPEIQDVLKAHNIEWPASFDDMDEGKGFIDSLTPAQAKALYEAFMATAADA
jgi:hypothetical protein